MKFVPRLIGLAAVASLLTGCMLMGLAKSKQEKPPAYTLRFYEEAPDNLPGQETKTVTIGDTHQTFRIDVTPWLTEEDVLKAELQPTPAGDAVLVKFDAFGAGKLMEMTTRIRGENYVIMVNERAVASILCEHIITNGQFQLVGDLSEEETKGLVKSLNKGGSKHRDIGDVQLEP